MKTYIVSPHFNRTDFIRLQYESLKRYFLGDFEYIIFNDAKPFADRTNFNNSNCGNEIRECCDELGLKCVDIPQDLHYNRTSIFPNTYEPNTQNNTTRGCDSVQYITFYLLNKSFGYLSNKSGFLFFIDSDIILFNDFDIGAYMKGYNASSWDVNIRAYNTHQNKNVVCAWTGFAIFNLDECPNLQEICWDCGKIKVEDTGELIGVDAGGQSYAYFEKYKDKIRYKHVPYLPVHDKVDIDKLHEDPFYVTNKSLESCFYNICKVFRYSLYIVNRGNCSCRKECFGGHNTYSFLHIKNGSNWDGAHISFKRLEYLFCENHILGIDNYDYYKKQLKANIEKKSSVNFSPNFEKTRKRDELLRLKRLFANEAQSYDKLLMMKDLYKGKDVEMLVLYPCNATIRNNSYNDDVIHYIESCRERLIVVCVDECVYKYIDYCDIALYYGTLSPGSADVDIINYNDIITCALHDNFYEIESEADINLIASHFLDGNRYDAVHMCDFLDASVFYMDPAPMQYNENTNKCELQDYINTQLNQPCRSFLWMVTKVNGDILKNLALRIGFITQVSCIQIYVNDTLARKEI